MNYSFHLRNPKNLHRCASSTFLLALSLIGVDFYSPAQAQPTPTIPSVKSPKPFSAGQKAQIQQILAISRQEKLCKTPVDLKVENASLLDVIARLKQLLPTDTLQVKVRGTLPVRLSFDLKGAKVGNIINNVAGLAGAKLYLLPEGLLISSPSVLSEAERDFARSGHGGDWGQNLAAGGSGWSIEGTRSMVFNRAVAQEATGMDAANLPAAMTKTTFGAFSPESQAMLQDIAEWINNETSRLPNAVPIHLDASSPVVIDTTKPNLVAVLFPAGLSEPNARTRGVYDQIFVAPTPDDAPTASGGNR